MANVLISELALLVTTYFYKVCSCTEQEWIKLQMISQNSVTILNMELKNKKKCQFQIPRYLKSVSSRWVVDTASTL